ncbi:MAG: hypothetical protein GXP16_04815 [Gammaproteobacteria bacterium]|nr:hypothetical protein [Gammaproteobacteria bacterium]
MNRNYTTTYPTNAQAICLRGVVCMQISSFIAVMESGKDFVAHPSGGSDG